VALTRQRAGTHFVAVTARGVGATFFGAADTNVEIVSKSRAAGYHVLNVRDRPVARHRASLAIRPFARAMRQP